MSLTAIIGNMPTGRATGGESSAVIANENVAYTWFGRPSVAYSDGKAWIGVTKDITEGTTQHIIEFDEATETYSTYRVGTVYDKDDHNQPSILVKSDGKLLTAYNEHSSAGIRIRLSSAVRDASTFGSETLLQPDGPGLVDGREYCYASLYELANGDIILFYRLYNPGVTGWRMVRSTDGGVTWGASTEFINMGGTQAYIVSCQDDTNKDIIHYVATDAHPMHNGFNPASIYHFYYNGGTNTFHKSDGTAISTPVNQSSATLVSQQISPDTSWMDDIACKNGVPRILFTHYPNAQNTLANIKNLYYKEWNGSAWTSSYKITQSLEGTIEEDAIDEWTEHCYIPNARFDVVNSDIIWAGIEVAGVVEIHKVVRNSPASFTITPITSGSTKTNWRPLTHAGTKNNVMWLRNNMYRYFTDYDMDLMAITQTR